MRSRAVQGVGVAVVVLLAAVVLAQLAFGLPRTAPSPSPTPTIDWSDLPVGSDASWPSCTPPVGTTETLPLAEDPAFVIVGVNDGLPGTESACIERELAWADTVTGGSSQPPLAYYVMAADPWTQRQLRWVPDPDWPDSNRAGDREVAVPAAFGSEESGTTCTGGRRERACAYVFGWRTALTDAALPGLRDPAGTRFWIDVEAAPTWNEDVLFNQAVVEGMAAAFTAAPEDGGVGTTTGIYTTRGEWPEIMGRLRDGSPLDVLDEWLAIGPATKAEAVEVLRTQWPVKPGGRLVMVQWVEGPIDLNVAAPAS